MTTHSPTKPALSPAVQQWLDNHQPRLMINNEFVEAKSGKVFESINPPKLAAWPLPRRPMRPTSMKQ